MLIIGSSQLTVLLTPLNLCLIILKMQNLFSDTWFPILQFMLDLELTSTKRVSQRPKFCTEARDSVLKPAHSLVGCRSSPKASSQSSPWFSRPAMRGHSRERPPHWAATRHSASAGCRAGTRAPLAQKSLSTLAAARQQDM